MENALQPIDLANSEYSKELAELFCEFLNQWEYPVAIIYGNPNCGKTDTGFLIAEIGLKEGALNYFASNMSTHNVGQQITSLEEVKYWHRHQTGKKLFILDEAGVNDDNRSPLSKQNREIRHEIFRARHFDVHWIFILQELKDLDNWKNSKLTGLKIEKSRYGNSFDALIGGNWIGGEVQPIYDFPRTSIKFYPKECGEFTLDRTIDSDMVQLKGLPAKVAFMYANSANFSLIGKALKDETGQEYKNMQVKRLLQQYLKQSLRSIEKT